jgi:hypothetical protein
MTCRVALLLSITLLYCSLAAAAPAQSQLDAALSEVKMEEKVFDASWQDTELPILVARMFDDGSRRNGYAGYLCMLLSEHGINGGVVRVVDVVGKEMRELGRASCK